MKHPNPKMPSNIDPLGVAILLKLHNNPVVGSIILGGGLALQHYHEFRPSHDIDAWWSHAPQEEAKAAIRQAVEDVARQYGFDFKLREWGETYSYEIVKVGTNEIVFSFQISTRDISIDSPVKSAWEPLLIETLRDNLGSKMNALVNRGAPRDFIDIHAVIKAGICTINDCWELWGLKNPGSDITQAKDKLLNNILQIEARQPLGSLSVEQRAAATERREFFKNEFLRNEEETNEHRR